VLAKKEQERKTTKIKHYPDKQTHTHTYTDKKYNQKMYEDNCRLINYLID